MLDLPEGADLPAEMKHLLVKLDDMLADKGTAAPESDLSASDRPDLDR